MIIRAGTANRSTDPALTDPAVPASRIRRWHSICDCHRGIHLQRGGCR
jgi:hypothetical protein